MPECANASNATWYFLDAFTGAGGEAMGEAPVAVPARDVRLEVAPPAAEPQGEVAHAKVAGGGSSDEAAAVERKTKRVSFAAAEFFAGFSEY
jgi:hypothetical protein